MAELEAQNSSQILVGMIVAILLFLVFLAKVWNKSREVKSTGKRFPPGGNGWPIIGDSFNWYKAVASSHPPRFVEQQVQKYGKIFSCRIHGKRAVVSAEAGFNRFVLQNEGRLFRSSYPKSFRDLVGKNGVITVHGEKQRKLHSIASNMMPLEKLRFHFLHDTQTVIRRTLLHGLQDGQVVPLQDVCRKVAIKLMVNQLLGESSESEVDEMAKLFSDFADGCLSLPIHFPGFAYHTAMKARESIIEKINKTIESHRKQGSQGIGSGLLRRLMEEQSIPDDGLADFILNLLFAGNETTAKTMAFAVFFLTHCSTAMKQLLDEHESLRTKSGFCDDMITWEDYKAMHWTQCVIDETLRIGGIAICLMREATVDIQYQDYIIPKGCFVVPFLSAVHLNDDIYPEPLTFNPWRWMVPENQDMRNWKNSPYFMPFGGGARFCPGAELARLQVAIFLHYFVTTYKWEQVKEDRMSFFPSARLVNGFQVQLTRI
nr:abietadienol/abietadienal oxidase [Ipomoea batatas]